MKNQVAMCVSHISAVAITKDLEEAEYKNVLNGLFQIIYISPELIVGTNKWQSALHEDRFQSRLCAIVVDEAHIVKKW